MTSSHPTYEKSSFVMQPPIGQIPAQGQLENDFKPEFISKEAGLWLFYRWKFKRQPLSKPGGHPGLD
jgi:hypothetical protein